MKIVDDIDASNSNICEVDAIEIVDNLKRLTDKEKRLSKYAACEYLNISRATFDNYVREGKLPRGKHEIGFKELSWDKKTLDKFIKKMKGK
jgi:predicted DNA-binding transcriptional regulator AlpA